MNYLDGTEVEIVTADYFRELGYEYAHGPQAAPDRKTLERRSANGDAHRRPLRMKEQT